MKANADLDELFRYNAAAPPPPCAHGERQTYFEQELPCVHCSHCQAAAVEYPKRDPDMVQATPWGDLDPFAMSRVKILFRRDGGRWVPIPCLVRKTNKNLDDAIDGAGLSGAFLS